MANYCISIHALLAESDEPTAGRNDKDHIFLSTLSLRRATSRASRLRRLSPFLSTLSLRRATLNAHLYYHSRGLFLSTLSLRRATLVTITDKKHGIISIHALLAESDRYCHRIKSALTYFYPRSPCGERHIMQNRWFMNTGFLSTLSLRRATLRVLDGSKSSIISIHALLAESDHQ